MIYITILKGSSIRAAASMWQHSFSTVHNTIYEVIASFMRIQDSFFVKASETTPAIIINNPKYMPFFENCIGALDGCHVSAVTEDGLWRNRKGWMSQNVLGVVNFDLTFSYILAGWEGSAHDGDVIRDALGKGLCTPPGKFYLGDAGYALTPYCLTPFRGVRYHLKEWAQGNRAPQNYKELYNLRHSNVRNVVERSFGIIKKRFPILTHMRSYPLHIQVDIVKTCFMLHNYIRVNRDEADDFNVPHQYTYTHTIAAWIHSAISSWDKPKNSSASAEARKARFILSFCLIFTVPS